MKTWEQIGEELTEYFNICPCQRKLKSIIDDLIIIQEKLDNYKKDGVLEFTGLQWLIVAIMDKKNIGICHGTNCEYPIKLDDHPFWKWLDEVKHNPNLEDN